MGEEMNWKDTVMNNSLAIKIYEKERGELNAACCGCPEDYIEPVLLRQAEISFKLGAREVVEWVEYYLNLPEIKDTYVDKIIRTQLKSKLKEWGLCLGLESDIEL